MAGMKALPSCRRHEMLPVSLTARLAVVPRKIPNAVQTLHHNQQLTTLASPRSDSLPGHDKTSTDIRRRDLSGEHRDGDFFEAHATEFISMESSNMYRTKSPYPMPRRTRVATNSPQCWVVAEPMGARRENTAAMKIVQRRPNQWFSGSLNQPAKNAIVMYGTLLMKPTIQLFFSQVPAASHASPVSGMPKRSWKVRFAPFEPVWSLCVVSSTRKRGFWRKILTILG